jgi:hypothetical protein
VTLELKDNVGHWFEWNTVKNTLKHLYGGEELNEEDDDWMQNGVLLPFDQREFIDFPTDP